MSSEEPQRFTTLEIVGDPDVGACVDGVCEVPPGDTSDAEPPPAATMEEWTEDR